MNVEELTTEQLEELLAAKKKKEKEAERKARQAYEDDRERLVHDIHVQAERLHERLAAFKAAVTTDLDKFYDRMQEYGDVRGSKGNFQLISNDGTMKVAYKIKQVSKFDERADMAEQKLVSFLERFVKARNKKTYKLVTSLLERTQSGDFDVNMINRLYKMENDFDDKDWVDAIRLFKESYAPQGTASYVNFYKRDAQGKFQNLTLNFSAI